MRTHTFVTLTVPPIVYQAIRQLLIDANYHHAFVNFGSDVEERIDMHGIGLKCQTRGLTSEHTLYAEYDELTQAGKDPQEEEKQ